MVRWMARNPRRTRAGASWRDRQGCCQGSRSSAARRRASQSWATGGQDEPGPAIGGGRIAEFRAGPAQGLLEEPERVFEIKAAQERLPAQVRPGGARVRPGGPQPHGLRRAVMGQVIDGEPDAASMTGSAPWWPSHAPRAFSFGCARFHDRAAAAPYRLVTVVVTASGSGRAASAASGQLRAVRSPACRSGSVPGRRRQAEHPVGASRPVTCTGRSRSSQARRACSYPASKITMMSGSPSFQCPAAASRVTTSRTWAAVTAARSSSGRSRTASSGRVQDVRPRSSAATSEYGQPGIICALLFPRP